METQPEPKDCPVIPVIPTPPSVAVAAKKEGRRERLIEYGRLAHKMRLDQSSHLEEGHLRTGALSATAEKSILIWAAC